MLLLPASEKSFWRQSYRKPIYPSLKESLSVDVAVVGGGIAGLTTAYLLKKAGLKVAVLEKRSLGSGTTGRTTGKVTSQHNFIYNDFQKRLGEQTARLYGEANQAALEQVANIIKAEQIDCAWQRADNYVFTDNQHWLKLFQREAEAAANLGLPASFVTETPLPFAVRGAVKFTNQGKLNAQAYLLGLAAAINGNGSYIFENSPVIGIRDGRPGRVRTRLAKVTAKQIVVATNVPTLPLMARGGYCIMEYPSESYIVAGPANQPLEGMYISPDKQHYSILPIQIDGKQIVLVGGESHISGLRGRKKERYHRLADYAEDRLGVTKLSNYWSDRDYQTYDGPPLVGKLYPWSRSLYVATAFRKWGLTNGTAAAMILRDYITEQPNAWAKIYSPQRLKPILSIPRVAAHFLLEH